MLYSYEAFLTANFNSHAHVERDHCLRASHSGVKIFQLTRSRGAWRLKTISREIDETFQLTRSRGAWRTALQTADIASDNFNSHAHVERDTIERELKKHGIDFNSHAHVERDNFNGEFIELERNFNSHAHVERDWRVPRLSLRKRISTHTLTWSVTLRLSRVRTMAKFQLTRSRGAWLMILPACWVVRAFQLTRSRGAWRTIGEIGGIAFSISTHTLTWSVTATMISNTSIVWFQLTRSRGAWHSTKHLTSLSLTFQLTRSRGAWLQWL